MPSAVLNFGSVVFLSKPFLPHHSQPLRNGMSHSADFRTSSSFFLARSAFLELVLRLPLEGAIAKFSQSFFSCLRHIAASLVLFIFIFCLMFSYN
uniref:Uncharacterized protein n=1 Tax=Anguilla anguilla TaxID=7936 RepID=A0A0E9X4L3_ANGAN